MKYTEKYHLPQWVKEDRIMMEDFNQMCSDIEAGLERNTAEAVRANAQTAAEAANALAQAAAKAAADAQMAQSTADKAVADAAKAQSKAEPWDQKGQPDTWNQSESGREKARKRPGAARDLSSGAALCPEFSLWAAWRSA